MSRLERRYRRLLFFYPLGYRRERADEIVGTLLDLAPEGRTRPTLREAVNLLRHGLRARLGRPASRGVVVWAGLTAVLCGLFAAAVGTRLGWETARPLPTVDETRAVLGGALPGHAIGHVDRGPALFVIGEQPVGWDNVGLLISDRAGEYELSTTRAELSGTPPIDQQQTLRTAQERLRAAGWTLRPVLIVDLYECMQCTSKKHVLRATRGDTILVLEIFDPPRYGDRYLSVNLDRATPWAAHAAGLLSGLLGFLGGWMVFGWASRRTEGRPMVRALAAVPYGLTMFMWGLPTAFMSLFAILIHVSQTHPRWAPIWEWIGQPTYLAVFILGWPCALLALGIAALPRRAGRGAGAPLSTKPLT